MATLAIFASTSYRTTRLLTPGRTDIFLFWIKNVITFFVVTVVKVMSSTGLWADLFWVGAPICRLHLIKSVSTPVKVKKIENWKVGALYQKEMKNELSRRLDRITAFHEKICDFIDRKAWNTRKFAKRLDFWTDIDFRKPFLSTYFVSFQTKNLRIYFNFEITVWQLQAGRIFVINHQTFFVFNCINYDLQKQSVLVLALAGFVTLVCA